MKQFRVKIMNAISPEGLAVLEGKYLLDPDDQDPDAILVRSAAVDTSRYPSLLAVGRAGAGVNNITVEAATARGICIFNAPGANANAVAELFFTMLGIWARNIDQSIVFCRQLAGKADSEITRNVEQHKAAFRGVELAGRTLGVLGLGQIGVRIANGGLLRNMKVVGFDPFPALQNIHSLLPDVVLARSRAEVVDSADILSLHMPMSEKTAKMVNGQFIERMKDGALLVNYARGGIVDQDAVLEALDAGRLCGYLTDFPSRKLLSHPKVLTTPHLGASTEESEEKCAVMAAGAVKAYLEYGTVSRSPNFPTVESIPASNCHTRFIMINKDIPDMIGFVSHTIGAHSINIISYINESNGVIGYNIIDLEGPIPPAVVRLVEAHPGVIRTRAIDYSRNGS